MLPKTLRDEIIAHARAEAPKEACGLIATLPGESPFVIRCTNIHPEPITRYRMSDDDLRAAFTQVGKDEDNFIAIYHSHPVSQPRPSVTDVAEARWPRQFYILISLRKTEPEVFAYRIRGGQIEDVELV